MVLLYLRILRRDAAPQSTIRISFFPTDALTFDRFVCFAVNFLFSHKNLRINVSRKSLARESPRFNKG